jgi:hypothetical protein
MGSSGSKYERGDVQDISDDEIAEFARYGGVTLETAMKMKGANWSRREETKDDVRYWLDKDKGDEEITSLVNAFYKYRDGAERGTRLKHEEYVKIANKTPGRRATILAAAGGPESKTLLGAVDPSKNTLIG